MGYEFEPDETVGDGVRRIAHEQVGDALDRLRGIVDEEVDDGDVPTAIHEARKCCKRLRGLVRLVRPALGDTYSRANELARDAARHLSDVRDAHALVETFDDLVAVRSDQVPDGGLGPLRDALADAASRATRHVVEDRTPVEAAIELLEELQRTIDDWPVDDDLLGAVAGGAAKSAGRAARRFAEVVDHDGTPPDELFHQWRKRVKYSWYHATLVEPAAPTLLGVQADLLHDLSDVLGDDHDLAVLTATVRGDVEAHGGQDVVGAALVLVEGSRSDLQRRAVSVGARLHAEEAEAWGRRLAAYMDAWWAHGPELDAGELDDLFDAADDLGDRTTGQLRDLARRIDLPGRSTMNRATLLATLRAHAAPNA